MKYSSKWIGVKLIIIFVLKIKKECGITNYSPNVKIVGGVEAVEHSWPAIAFVYIVSNNEAGICAGTLIDKKTVLTAAHW